MMITFKEVFTEIEDLQEADQMQGQQIDPNIQKQLAGQLFMRGRAVATAAHIAHLQTPSFAEHSALNELYEGIVPLVDSFAESFQGIAGKIEVFPNVKESSTIGLQITGNYYKWLIANQEAFGDKPELINQIQEILAFLNKISYKLRELK